jgi:hypothetical protein
MPSRRYRARHHAHACARAYLARRRSFEPWGLAIVGDYLYTPPTDDTGDGGGGDAITDDTTPNGGAGPPPQQSVEAAALSGLEAANRLASW